MLFYSSTKFTQWWAPVPRVWRDLGRNGGVAHRRDGGSAGSGSIFAGSVRRRGGLCLLDRLFRPVAVLGYGANAQTPACWLGPVGRALLQKGADAFVGFGVQQIVHHSTACGGIGLVKRQATLCCEGGFADAKGSG